MVYHVHPRSIRGNTHKPRYKGAAVTNYDWLLYCLLQRYFKRQPGLCDQITFQIPEAFDVRYKVFNRRFMLTHGDRLGARGGDGFIGAMGPIMRGRARYAGSVAHWVSTMTTCWSATTTNTWSCRMTAGS